MSKWIQMRDYEEALAELATRHGLELELRVGRFDLRDRRTFKLVAQIAINGKVTGIKEGGASLCSPAVIGEIKKLKR
jgi:hypothetical protein